MNNLNKRKELAAKVLGVGKNKIVFDNSKLTDIKEAITKQDIRDMYASGVIMIKEARGKRKIIKRTTKRGMGKIKKRIKNRKSNYVRLVRKLRAYVKELKNQGKISTQEYANLRKKIKSHVFKNKANLKESLQI